MYDIMYGIMYGIMCGIMYGIKYSYIDYLFQKNNFQAGKQ